jgi:Flp pilus assembly protein TadG
MTRRLHRDERGVTIVEAAFVIPILFLFVFGLIDIGLWEFQNSQASGAARDGARVGILKYLAADQASPPSANYSAIDEAVRARLGGQSYTLTVTCLAESSTTTKACNTAVVDHDRIQVVVTWQHPSLTYVGQLAAGNSQTVTGTATMVINGLPA